jgi:hypothetical protein
MNPALVTLIIFVLEEVIKLSPALVAEFQKLFSNGVPTADQWAALRTAVASKSYADYVPASALTAPAPAPALPADNIVTLPGAASAEATPPPTQAASPAPLASSASPGDSTPAPGGNTTPLANAEAAAAPAPTAPVVTRGGKGA